MFTRPKLLLLFAALAFAGCGGVHSVSGGTKGHLQVGSGGVQDVQVTVHQADGTSWKPVGFGVTTADGSFDLFQNGAKGPLWLTPGDYRCTLDSAGAPLAIPGEFTRPETTPLVASVKSADDALDLKAPQFSPQ